MVRRLMISTLVACGLLLVSMGVQKWLDGRAAEQTVRSFMAAMQAGDRNAVLPLLAPERRKLLEAQAEEETLDRWASQVGVTYRIQHVKIDKDDAVVQMWIEKEGFVIKPSISLHRGETGRWKIDHVDHLQIDPLWDDLQRVRSQQEDERLADQLRQAFQNDPGATVDRTPLTDVVH